MREQFAFRAFREKQEIKYIHTLLMVQSIMTAANTVAAAVGNGEAPPVSKINDLLTTYKELLMPEFVEERLEKVKKVKTLMETEAKIGSFKVEAMVFEKRKNKGLN